MNEINMAVEERRKNYPKYFYQVLEKLDLVMRNYIGDEVGTRGTIELNMLCAIFAIDWELEYNMPASARAWFVQLVNPKNGWYYHHEHGNIMGFQLKAYADLRQYLIDNAERVIKAYNMLIECRDRITKEDVE